MVNKVLYCSETILINMEFDAVLGGWKTANDGLQMSFKINCSGRNIFALQSYLCRFWFWTF